jgi:hypothetical protein
MFNYFKSTETLTTNLRTWALEDCMQTMPPSEKDQWKEHFDRRNIRDVAEEVASKCMSEVMRAEMLSKTIGTPPNLRDHWRYTIGLQLVRDLAKRERWNAVFEGAPAFGYRCTLDTIKGTVE